MAAAPASADHSMADGGMPSKKMSRKVWDKSSSNVTVTNEKERGSSAISKAVELPDAVAGESPAESSRRLASSAAKFSKLAKYAPHHLPDPSSRCGSQLVSQYINYIS